MKLRSILAGLLGLVGLSCVSDAQLLTMGVGPGSFGTGVTCTFATGLASDGSTCISTNSTTRTCNGANDNTTAFQSFATWATGTYQPAHPGVQITLSMPAGQTCQLSDFGVTFEGILNWVYAGNNSTLIGQFFHLGSASSYQDRAHSVRVNTVSLGATSATVNPALATQPSNGCNTVAACAGLFTVGQYAVLAGVDIQSGSGFPPNSALYQFVKITNVNTVTGVITFANDPARYTYKSTWPDYNVAVDLGSGDFGGPATLFALHPGWGANITYKDVTLSSTGNNALDLPALNVTMNNVTCTSTGNSCYALTIAKTTTFLNSSAPNSTWEIDKWLDDVFWINTTVKNISFQSAQSVRNMTFTNSTVTGNITGSGFNLSITGGSVASIALGTVYGQVRSVTLTNTSIPSYNGANFSQFTGCGAEGLQNAKGWSITGGVIKFPNAYVITCTGNFAVGGLTTAWSPVGANVCFGDDSFRCTGVFQVTDLSQTGSMKQPITFTPTNPLIASTGAHGLSAGDWVSFYNGTGAGGGVPPEFSNGLMYCVIATGLDATHFEVSATCGGAAITPSTAGTGSQFAVTGYTLIATTLNLNAFPVWPSQTKLAITNHPAPSLTGRGISGGSVLGQMLNSAPAGAPTLSYIKYNFTNADTAGAGGNPHYTNIWGNVTTWTANVTQAYGGAITPSTCLFCGEAFQQVYTPTLTAFSWAGSVINFKQAGLRTFDTTGGYPAAWTGGQAGDTLTGLSQSGYIADFMGFLMDDISTDPGNPMAVSFEVKTNQGVVLPQ